MTKKRSSKRRPTKAEKERDTLTAAQMEQAALAARRLAQAGTGVFQENIKPYLATLLMGARTERGESCGEAAERVLSLPKDVGYHRARTVWVDYERHGFGPDDPNWHALTRYMRLDPAAVRMMEKGYPWMDIAEGNEPENLWEADPVDDGKTSSEVPFEGSSPLYVEKPKVVVDEAFRRLFDEVLERLLSASVATMAEGEDATELFAYVKIMTAATFDVIDLCRKGGQG